MLLPNKKTFLALSLWTIFLLARLVGLQARTIPSSGKEVWLAELEEKVRSKGIQADSAAGIPRQLDSLECPLVVDGFHRYDCGQPPCRSDADCPREEMCCSNGCVRTCITKSNPPLLVDWVLYPGQLPSDHAWLLSGPQSAKENGYYCSTSNLHKNASPLLCPGGFICHIDDQGDPSRSIPNRGRCIVEEHLKTFDTKEFVRHDVTPSLSIVPSSPKKKLCSLNSIVYSDNTRFYHDGRPCVCNDGIITCYKRVA